VRFVLRVILLALSFGIGTWILGWWAVPLFAAIAAFLAPNVPHQGMAAALAAGVAWGTLLAWTAAEGSVWSFSRVAGGAMGVSGLTLILLTLAFPAAVAWAVTVITQLLTRAKPVTN